jgi:hypothetical protein
VQRRGSEVLQEAEKWMGEVKDDRFFAWLHFYDVHTPYEPPEPFLSRYRGYPGARYDGEIAYLDSLMGELFDWLEKADLEDDTLVVFIGDHGESLGQHEENTHGFFIYDATMHVPFLMKAPYRHFRAGGRIPAQVRNVDLMPTILDLVAIEPPSTIQGTSLAPLLEGESEDLGLIAYSESFYPRHHYGWAELKAVETAGCSSSTLPAELSIFRKTRSKRRTSPTAGRHGAGAQTALDDLVARYGVEGIDEKGPETPDADTAAQLAASAISESSKIQDRSTGPPDRDKSASSTSSGRRGHSGEDRIERRWPRSKSPRRVDILEAHTSGNLYTKQKDFWLSPPIRTRSRATQYKSALYGLAATYQKWAARGNGGRLPASWARPRDNRLTVSRRSGRSKRLRGCAFSLEEGGRHRKRARPAPQPHG